MNPTATTGTQPVTKTVVAIVLWMVFFSTGLSWASSRPQDLPPDVVATIAYLLDYQKKAEPGAFEVQRLEPYLAFISTPKSAGEMYSAGGSFGDPSAYNQFTIDVDLQSIMDYTLDANIPSFFFWPSSLRMSIWTSMDGGREQLALLKNAAKTTDRPFVLRGTEHISITPDQHTGAYFSYDVDKVIVLCPYGRGTVLISIQSQIAPSAVGRKGWVLGEDEEWSYLYTDEKGLGIKGLGWADTYMYDSYNVTVYYQPESAASKVICSSTSWVNAGWAGINMVKPKHIYHGLTRVAEAFTAVLKNPRLPEPDTLAETFAKKEDLSTSTLRKYTSTYFAALERRISASDAVWKKIRHTFNGDRLLDQMTRDEMYATLALDYFKKVLGNNPVMDTHPF